MLTLQHINIDCFSIILSLLTPRDIFTLKSCNRFFHNMIAEDSNLWMMYKFPISKPDWISTNFMFANKLRRKSYFICMKCDTRVDRFCLMTLCKCIKHVHWNGMLPRWHTSCVLKKRLKRAVGGCKCLLCKKPCMYVKVTSFP